MPIFVVALDPLHNENETKEVLDTEITLGRSFLGFECEDRRISRKHGLLIRGEDKVTIKALHENPLYFKKRGVQNEVDQSVEVLLKESERELMNDDAFGLLREKFWYKIKVCNNNEQPINGEGIPILRVRQPVELNLSQNLPQILSDVVHQQQQQEQNRAATPDLDFASQNLIEASEPKPMPATTSNEAAIAQPEPINPLKRPQTWTQACSQSIDSTTTDTNDEPVVKKSREELTLPSEGALPSPFKHGEATPAPQPVTNNDNVAAGPSNSTNNSDNQNAEDVKPVIKNEVLSSPFEHGEATPAPQPVTNNDNVAAGPSNGTNNSDNQDAEDVKPVIKKEAADSSALRDSCQFGIRCYRTNVEHRTEFAHPGDQDYRRPNYPPASADAPPCPFGASCYRRNPQHFVDFSHPDSSSYIPQSSQPPPPPLSTLNQMQVPYDSDESSDNEDDINMDSESSVSNGGDFGASSSEEFQPSQDIMSESGDSDIDGEADGQANEE